ncbi:hypothetical protein KQI86_08545 [Clostridium sp. MSJ-11]|uniref:Uncharacterized protein n=1 Tax=Clostridium mobile TaxID=2841512 RepID=A0ABS6EJ08_9CLOT|nr:hypothetical protein [Clostridium mobile]MBU5484374.1 hypothetical protein [Clostridium mobile]
MITKKVFNIETTDIYLNPLKIYKDKVILYSSNNLYSYYEKKLYTISENVFSVLYDNDFVELNTIIYTDITKINDKYTLLIKEYMCDTEKVKVIFQTDIYTNTIDELYELCSRGKMYFNRLNDNYILYGYNISDDYNTYVNVLYDIENSEKIILNKIDFRIRRSYLVEFNDKKFLLLEKNDLDRWDRIIAFFYRSANNMDLQVHESLLMLIDLENILFKNKNSRIENIDYSFINKMINFIGYCDTNIFYELIDFKADITTIVKYNIVSKEKEYINIKPQYDSYIQFNGKDFYIIESNKIQFLNDNKNIELDTGRIIWNQFIDNEYFIISQVKPDNHNNCSYTSYIYNNKDSKFKLFYGFIYYMEHSDILINIKNIN